MDRLTGAGAVRSRLSRRRWWPTAGRRKP